VVIQSRLPHHVYFIKANTASADPGFVTGRLFQETFFLMQFSELGLRAELLRSLSEQNYIHPTKVQCQAIPAILGGRDLLAAAQTGTGKTAGFALPLLQRLSENHRLWQRPVIRGLVLTPTRELAAQVNDSMRVYGRHLPLRSLAIFGGVGFAPQLASLRRGVDVLVATPGRLLDHMQQGTVDLSQLNILVLDEADRMLDMGFIHDIKRIIKSLPPANRQNLLFSATFSDEIHRIADSFLKNPVKFVVEGRNSTVELVNQVIHPVDRSRKRELLSYLIGSENWRQVLVFTRTKHGANKLAEQLTRDGLNSTALHGNKSQGARTRALADFKRGGVRVLVATDIAARGLDIDDLPHVVNFDLPNVPEDYVHRIGRTARAGKPGTAVSLVCVDERNFLESIERLIRRKIVRVEIEGFAPDPKIKAEPIFKPWSRMGSRSKSGRGKSGRPQARGPKGAGKVKVSAAGGRRHPSHRSRQNLGVQGAASSVH
jgi:ATP-dependent RNA helicase RhlE